jgi:DnaK suppressor protein
VREIPIAARERTLACAVHLGHAMQRTQRIRDRLLKQRAQLLSRYRNGVERTGEELEALESESEEVERATELWDTRVQSSLGDNDVRELAGIVAAIQRIDEGTYGLCQHCDRRIEPARLDALPAATSCIDCATDQEVAQQMPAMMR